MITVNADNVTFEDGIIVNHNRTRSTSDYSDTAIIVNGKNFVSKCDLRYEGFGYCISG